MEEKLTVYEGERLFKYLNNLKQMVKEEPAIEGTSANNAHKQLYQILETEEKFLRQYSPQPQLAFTLNGMPSADSLKADLETMCKLEEFKELAEKYQPNADQEKLHYELTTEKDWNKQKQKNNDNLTTKTRFKIQETQDRKLELTLTEESYLDAPDQTSQKEPLLIRQATTAYSIQWDYLLHETQEKHFMAKKQTISHKKQSYFTPIRNFLHEHDEDVVISFILAMGIGALTFLGTFGYHDMKIQTAKRQAIVRCADTNSDGQITDKEQADLLGRIATENNALYEQSSSKFLGNDCGRPIEGKAEWFKNYKCNK